MKSSQCNIGYGLVNNEDENVMTKLKITEKVVIK